MNACMLKVEEVRLMESRKSARLQHDSVEGHPPQLQYVQPFSSPIIRSHVSSSISDVPELALRNRCVIRLTLIKIILIYNGNSLIVI